MGVAARRIRLLGKFEVEGVEASSLGSRKGRTLLKRLALDAGRPVSVDALVDTLWPDDAAPARPADQVSVLVSRLRRALGADAVTYTDGAYTLTADWLDVDELRERVEEAARRLEDGSAALSRAAAAAALALVRGPLLAEDPDEPWTRAARAEVARVVARARQVAAEGALAGGLASEAAEHAAAALAADRYDEAALRLLMRAHLAAGRPALALAAYAETAAVIAADLGVDLDPQSQELHLAVLRGETATVVPPPSPTALVGRDEELSALDSALNRAFGGNATVVVVEGEPGIGKSHLLTVFADRVAGSVQVLRASADSSGVLPMEPILGALARRLSAAPGEERAAILGADADLLDPLLRPGVTGDAAYRDLLVAYEPGDQSAPAVLHLALLAVFARLCTLRPVALLIDDAHLADAATISWLGLLAGRGAGLPVLAVAAQRPSDRGLPHADTITLGRLDPRAASAIVAPYVEASRVDAVVERSAGLPLFLVELAHATGESLPDSIRDSVVARLVGVGDAAVTIHAAAVLGRDIDVDLLATVLERPTGELLDDLEAAARRRILTDAATGYVFNHELVREALAADTASARRAWLHRQAAKALSRRATVEHLTVAQHARLGGDLPLAARALCAAAEQAGARFDHDAALALAADSLGLADSAAAHLIRGRSLVLLRRYDEARLEAESAHALGAGAPALEIAAFAAYYARDLDAVLRLADEAAAISDDPEVLDTCQYLAAKVLHTQGHISEAEKRLAPMTQAPMRSVMASFSRTWRGFVHIHRGHVDAAARDLAGSDAARRAPVPYAPLYVDQFLAHLAGLDGRPLDVLTIADRWRNAVSDQDALRFAGRAEVYRGWALSLLCEPSALDSLEEARDLSRSAGNPEPLGQASLDIAGIHLDNGDVAAATKLLDEVGNILAAGGQVSNGWRIELRSNYLRGRLALLSGDPAGAAAAADAVVSRARADHIDRYEVLGLLLAIEARALAGERISAGEAAVLLPQLLAAARPEAWRVTARLGAALQSDALLAWSSERVEELASRSGPYADQVRSAAAAALSSGR